LLVVHIGTPKTGTKALQSFLRRNSEILAEQGILYLKSGRLSERHKRLSVSHSALVSLLQVRSEREAWADLRAELEGSTCHTNVMSAEGFWFSDPAQFRAELPKSQPIRLVVYLRRQDQYLQSLWKQAVTGGRQHSFKEWRRRRPTRGDYLSTVEKWVDVFGSESMLIRPYQNGSKISTVEDFCEVLGVKGSFETENTGRNPSPRRELAYFLRALNNVQLNVDVDRHRIYRAIVGRSERYVRTCDMLSYAECVALMEEHAEGNRILIEKYYRDGPTPLFPDLSRFESEEIWAPESEEFLQLTKDVFEVLIDFVLRGEISSIAGAAAP
jgi:hypothetical protein